MGAQPMPLPLPRSVVRRVPARAFAGVRAQAARLTLVALVAPCAAVAHAAAPPGAAVEATSDAEARAFWRERTRGWHFYETLPPTRLPAPAAPPRATAAPAAPSASARARLAQQEQALNDARATAILAPTDANVRRYMALEAHAVAQASRFADVAQRVAWATPALDPSVEGRPVNAKALAVFEQAQQTARARAVAALAPDHVVLFFFRSDCPYCHAFAPTLTAFATAFGLTLVPISLDGGTLPGLAGVRADNGIAATLAVTTVPAVFLAQPFSGAITPVGVGVLSQAQLLERLAPPPVPPPPSAALPLSPSPSRSLP